MKNKKNQILTKNNNNINNNNWNINNYNQYELNEKEIKYIKNKINIQEQNNELDNNNPFVDISSIIKKNILSKKEEKNDENFGYSKRKNFKSSKNVNNYSIPIKKKYAYSDKNIIKKYVNTKKVNKDEEEKGKQNSYQNLYKNKINNNNKIKEPIKELEESLMDIII